ncbi:L,D-transpeptidase [Actinophytocola sp.]|uniref:L,D-transpeptidase n=1 Tax=Actinophytocola sp. TaxID=1872138 RepID=UPI002D808D52|nr:Ig-like domain-containing protein [Actinophytocola sp.]HET9143585.1 Ig-like domain-containing protein [Actinophytocola sp.]
MARTTRAAALVLGLALVVPLGLVACGRNAEGERPRFAAPSPGASPDAPPTSTAPPEPFSLAVTPAGNAKNLPISTEVGTKVTGGRVSSVTLSDDKGAKVSGEMRDDGTAWVPAKPLKYGRTYTATVTVERADGGAPETRTTTFATMRSRPGRVIGSGLYMFDGKTYGVAMPVVAEFNPGIAPKDRANVERRLFVRSDPPQPGVWHWVDSGTQAYYRPPSYWQPGTKLTVRLAIEGLPVGKGRYGNVDRTATATIGRKLTMDVDNKTKQMYVYRDGKLVRTIPVSLGKKSTPSSSGTMVVMEKKESTVFDTFAELGPVEGYRTDIAYAQRITWSGQYIHAAPWSVGAQGRRNVSHGCVNMSNGNAVWLFRQTLVGDPITVKGTERKLANGDGWTAWNHSWQRYIKGSALPVPPELAAAAAAGDGDGAAGDGTATVGPTVPPAA